MPDGQSIVVLGFETRFSAREALAAATWLRPEGDLEVRDAVFVSRDDRGRAHVEETRAGMSTDCGALGGAFWRPLFAAILPVATAAADGAGASALLGRLLGAGVSDQFVRKVRESACPGRTYLALLVRHPHREVGLAELRGLHGIADLVDSSMPDEVIAQVRDALATADAARAADGWSTVG